MSALSNDTRAGVRALWYIEETIPRKKVGPVGGRALPRGKGYQCLLIMVINPGTPLAWSSATGFWGSSIFSDREAEAE